jgi:hypothetical protein
MTASTVLEALQFAALVVIGALLVFSRSYSSRKGENLATKEDVEEITRKIETVKSSVDRVTHASKLQFELELKIYAEIWEHLVQLNTAALELPLTHRGELGDADPKSTAFQSVREQAAQKVAKAYQPFVLSVDRHRPFYAPVVYDALNDLIEIMTQVSERQRDDSTDADLYWGRVEADLITARHQIDAVCEAIRRRIHELGGELS